MSSSFEKLVPLLDRSNYLIWADVMKSYLMSQGLWRITNGSDAKPTQVAMTSDKYESREEVWK
jgi:hypothetical protein